MPFFMANRGDSSSSATSTHLFRITFRWDKKKKKKNEAAAVDDVETWLK